MILKLYDYDGEKAVLTDTLTPDETDGPRFKFLPPVWRANGERLHPEDGEEYLRALHEELKRGSQSWSVLEE